MYTTYFLIGFVTSFGWWSAGKIQKTVDNTAVEVRIETKVAVPAKPTTDAK
jgi:hypothetical protein